MKLKSKLKVRKVIQYLGIWWPEAVRLRNQLLKCWLRIQLSFSRVAFCTVNQTLCSTFINPKILDWIKSCSVTLPTHLIHFCIPSELEKEQLLSDIFSQKVCVRNWLNSLPSFIMVSNGFIIVRMKRSQQAYITLQVKLWKRVSTIKQWMQQIRKFVFQLVDWTM